MMEHFAKIVHRFMPVTTYAESSIRDVKQGRNRTPYSFKNATFKPLILPVNSSLKVVSATFLLVWFLDRNESTCQIGKMFFISLQRLFSFSRK